MSQTDIVEKLGKASRQAALMTLAGVIVVLLSLGYSAYQLRYLENEKKQLNVDIAKLTTKKTELTTQYQELTASIAALSYAKVSPHGQVFQLKASAKDIPGRRALDGSPLYQFSVYVDASQDVLAKITKVAYELDDPSMKKPHKESTDASNKFAAGYTGWGCFSEVDATIYFKDGTTQSLPFNMCKSLGPEWD